MGFITDVAKPIWDKRKADKAESQKRTNAHNIREALKDNFHVGRNKIAFGATGIYANGIGDGSVHESAGTYVYRNGQWVRKDSLNENTENPVNLLIKIR